MSGWGACIVLAFWWKNQSVPGLQRTVGILRLRWLYVTIRSVYYLPCWHRILVWLVWPEWLSVANWGSPSHKLLDSTVD